jgi:MoaA/NifB/PqqE/SkfB family radical SAM enzyme
LRFNIEYSGGEFLIKDSTLSDLEHNYIQEYLDKVKNYKIIGYQGDSPVFSLYQPPLASPAGIRSLEMRLNRKFKRSKIPATATVSITKACQCECDHCSAFYYNHSSERNLSLEDFKEAIQQTSDLGVTTIILLGGEPLLRKGFMEMVSSIDKTKVSIIMFTNGEYLTKEIANNLKDAGLLGAFISFDSWVEEEHDILRKRKGLFQKAIQGIHNLNEAGLISGVSTYLSPDRVEQNGFEKMVDFTKSIGAHEITYFDAIPSGKWLHDESHILRPEDHRLIRTKVRSHRHLPDSPGFSVQSTMTSGECGSAFCFAGNTQFYLSASGNFCPCDFTPLTIGKFPEHSIRELWEKLVSTEPYDTRAKACRMQNPEFRKKYIYPIPKEGPFPYPLSKFLEN